MIIYAIIGLAVIVVLLLAAAAMMPGRSNQNLQAVAAPLPPYAISSPRPDSDEDRWRDAEDRWRDAMADWERRSLQSLREREIEEDAAAIASEFRRVRHEKYLTSLRADAAEYFGSASPAAAKKSAT